VQIAVPARTVGFFGLASRSGREQREQVVFGRARIDYGGTLAVLTSVGLPAVFTILLPFRTREFRWLLLVPLSYLARCI
jgi:hypothetical protein